jgi:hypothetical protein
MQRTLVALVAFLSTGCGGIPPSPVSPPVTATGASSAPRVINIVIDPGTLPIGGGTALIRLEVIGVNGSGVRDAAVALAVSGGNLEAEQAVTDATGHAKVEWTGTKSEIVTATIGELAAVTTIRVDVPPAPIPPGNPVPPPVPPTPPTDPPTDQPQPPQIPGLEVFLAASPEQAIEGQTVTFTATARGLSNENVTSYQWDFDGDGTSDATSSVPTSATAYATHGVKPARVTIRTTAGRSASGTRSVTISTAPPGPALLPLAVNLTASLGPHTTTASVTFAAAVTTADPAGVPASLTYAWDFDNDGTANAVTTGPTPGISPPNTFATAGSKSIKVTVTAPDGRTASHTIPIMVTTP